ncbi:MAG TPA: hypothetical protein VEL28_09905 [Candidatus Binatia bacterium]|nr:hypothetical protein [Candidatus Binatia bacterium]
MPKRDKKDVEKQRNEEDEFARERELLLATVAETPAERRAETKVAMNAPSLRGRWRPIDKNGFALPKPDRRWLH